MDDGHWPPSRGAVGGQDVGFVLRQATAACSASPVLLVRTGTAGTVTSDLLGGGATCEGIAGGEGGAFPWEPAITQHLQGCQPGTPAVKRALGQNPGTAVTGVTSRLLAARRTSMAALLFPTSPTLFVLFETT